MAMIERDERTKFNRENILKIAFHPKRMLNFTEGIGDKYPPNFFKDSEQLMSSATLIDIMKFLFYIESAGLTAYNYFCR
jgi:hypothetical protein